MKGYILYWPERAVIHPTLRSAKAALETLRSSYRDFRGKIAMISAEELSFEDSKICSDRDSLSVVGEALVQAMPARSMTIQIYNPDNDGLQFDVALSDGTNTGSGSGIHLADAITMAKNRLQSAKDQIKLVAVSVPTTATPPAPKLSAKDLKVKK